MSVGSATGRLDELHIEGTSYEPIGDVKTAEGTVTTHLPTGNALIREAALVCSLCNDSRITYDEVIGYAALCCGM